MWPYKEIKTRHDTTSECKKKQLTAQGCFELLGLTSRQRSMKEDRLVQQKSDVHVQKSNAKVKKLEPGPIPERPDEQESDFESSSIKNPFTDSSESDWSISSDDPSYDPLKDPDLKLKDGESELECQNKSAAEEYSEDANEPEPFNVSHAINNVPVPVVEDSCDSIVSQVFPIMSESIISAKEEEVKISQRGSSANKWDKKHACKYCGKTVTKMSTHLQRVHKNEEEVMQVLKEKKGSKVRKRAWGRLLNEGDYKHNFEVLRKGSGILIPKYRSKKRTVKDYVTCSYCKGMYFKSLLASHVTNCKENPGMKKKRGQAVREGALMMPVPKNFSEAFYRNVIANMNLDDVLRLIKNDHLLICFGERMYYRRDLEEHTSGHISGRLRELGRLLKCLREQSAMKISTLTQALHVSNFDTLVACVRKLAEFDESCNQFKKGTLALKIGYSLKKCASILKTEAIKNEDLDLQNQAQSFEDLIGGDWYDLVSATASQSIHRAKQNKPKLLPACQDIEKMHHLLNDKCKSQDYVTLAKATLCLISLFNRKRGGEVQRIKVSDFERGMLCGATNEQDILQGLSESERQLMDYFNRIEIRGKFNRTVPVLLTSQMTDNIKRLLKMRQSLEPPIDSAYLFASRTGERPYRGSDVIRDFAKEAEVSDLTIFTFTHLRKQIATLSQTMEISKWEQDQLAKFLGHDIRIHRNVYRQPSDVLDRAKVAKILLNVNKGMAVSSRDLDMDENEELDETNSYHGNEEDNSSSYSDEDEEATYRLNITTRASNSRVPTDNFSKDMATASTCPKPTSVTKKSTKRKTWSAEEKQAVKRQLHACITMNRVPKKHEAEKAISNEPVLKGRTWRNIKDFVYNIVKKTTS